MGEGLPIEVARFIARHIRSVEQLEILLLLRRQPKTWSGTTVASELRIDASSASRRLEELAAAGFVTPQDGGFVYASRPENDRDVDAVARAYGERRVAVITEIFSQPTDSLRSFADAFRFKGGK